MTDTAADITAGLNGLDGSNIASITISDDGAVGVSVAELTSDATAISKLANQNGSSYQLAVTDSAADITAGLNGLNGSNIASITISDNGAIGISVAELTSDAAAISKLANASSGVLSARGDGYGGRHHGGAQRARRLRHRLDHDLR